MHQKQVITQYLAAGSAVTHVSRWYDRIFISQKKRKTENNNVSKGALKWGSFSIKNDIAERNKKI